MSSLPTPLRRQLESASKQARRIAEAGARKALEALAVHDRDPYRHMDEAQLTHRKQLRAQAKQLGDGESQTKRGAYDIKHLVEKLAYDQWHRLLFARFLLENNLLISPEHGVSVSLDDCEELAPTLGMKDAWAVAARFAAVELPEIFRADDPAGGVELPVEDRKGLIQLVTALPMDVFTASDSLGWCYQFWQAEKKDEVNKSGNKIGADELPAVTQLFTEDYMVDFLLDNTLGAWWAGKQLALNPQLSTLNSEEELRQACALPGCPWKYLRLIRTGAANVSPSPPSEGGEGRGEVGSSQPSTLNSQPRWTPAAGTFDGWPKTAKELKCLDPCMGSGHFVVAMFERLVALRLAEEKLDEAAAVAAVIRDNLFGLEIDPRCTQIGAFNLALAAWRRVGHCKLPAMNLACSGLAPNTTEKDWVALAGDNDRLQRGMARLHALFKHAPILGSLINPSVGEGDLIEANFHEVAGLLAEALSHESPSAFILQPSALESAVTARGLAKAAEILAGQFTLVATNVPYLGRAKQDDVLQDYCERTHPEAKADLATCFVERCLDLCDECGSTALVTPQNWLFLGTYKKIRQRLLKEVQWDAVARLGPRAFETIGGEVVNVALLGLTRRSPREMQSFVGCDASAAPTPTSKADQLCTAAFIQVGQKGQLGNPDARIVFEFDSNATLLSRYALASQGIPTSDGPLFVRKFWELPTLSGGWEFHQGTVLQSIPHGGREDIILFEKGKGRLRRMSAEQERDRRRDFQGANAWGRTGVAVSLMNELFCTLYTGEKFDNNVSAVVPSDPQTIPALWTYCTSVEFTERVRQIDQKLNVTNATLVKVPFDLAHWQKVAAEKYPDGLPKPFSSDPTQWLFNGHPAGAGRESTPHPGPLPDRGGEGGDKWALHVAVARLLGYQWPRQTGSSFPDCPALAPDGLETLADDDGIVPISPAKGEAPAAERLRELLARAYGKDWNASRQEALLAQVDYAGASLEDWLRNGFFEQHNALFHHRPFIWHVWDGLKNGFSALVNYHKLTHANLEKLTYSYLGNWIQRQQAGVAAGEAGSDAKLQAARQLQATLKLILEGEPPYDIFVRWKALAQQSIGWHPDLNDGVRMNIRPFLAKDIAGGKKGAGILRTKPNVKWEKDRGKEPMRDRKEFPWFWGWDEERQDFGGVGKEPDGNRWNDCHYTNDFKESARATNKSR